jgi:hypothetical protein
VVNVKEVFPEDLAILEDAASFDKDFPSFYQNASRMWDMDEAESLKFYLRCSRLFGLFNEDRLFGLVQCENITDSVTNTHLDIRRGSPISDILEGIAEVRDRQFESGMKICTAWILKKNRPMRRILEAVGFKPTFLSMKAGMSHNKVLTWNQMAIAPDSYDKRSSI